jgi:1-phosphofructokinase family hexose kinase
MIATVTLNPSLDEWVELPELKIGRLNRATGFSRYPGGKGINVSRVVHELGGRTVAFGVAGGEDGTMLSNRLDALGIRHRFIPVGGQTRNNYKILAGNVLTEINTAGPAVTSAALQALRKALLRRPWPRYAVLSGSLPPGAPAGIYRDWITACRRRRIRTVLDASGPALRAGLRAHPWMIKPNREEAESALGRRLSTTEEVKRGALELLNLGSETVVLSLGKEGAILVSRKTPECWLAKPPTVKTRSAVGAGDSLVAGLVTATSRGEPLPEAFRWGVACGAATAMTEGTQLCRRRDVMRLMARVRLRRAP